MRQHPFLPVTLKLLLVAFSLCFGCTIASRATGGAAIQCNYTLLDAMEERAHNFKLLLELKNSPFGIGAYWDDLNQQFTFLAPTDAAFLNGVLRFDAFGGSVANVSLDMQRNDAFYNSLALYHLLPEATLSVQNLVELGTVATGLSQVYGDSFTLAFEVNEAGRVTVVPNSTFRPVIIEQVETCNGNLLVTNQLLLPSQPPKTVPSTTFDWGAFNTSTASCSTTLYSQLREAPEISTELFALEEAYPEVVQFLNETSISATLFLMTSPALLEFNAIEGIDSSTEADLRKKITQLLLYSVVPGAHCPASLVALGTKNTILGWYSNQSLPLTFNLGQNGQVEISGRLGSDWSATIVSTYSLCDSVVHVVDGPILLPLSDMTDLQHVSLNLVGVPESTYNTATVVPCRYPVHGDYLAEVERMVGVNITEVPQAPAPCPQSVVVDEEDEDHIAIIAITVPLAAVSVLLIAVTTAAACYIKKLRARKLQRYSNTSGSGGVSNDKSKEINTEELMVEIARAASERDNWGKISGTSIKKGGLYSTKASSSTDCQQTSPPLTPSVSWQTGKEVWEIMHDELEFSKHKDGSLWVLGAGGCGEVYKGVKGGVQDVAIKVLSKVPKHGTHTEQKQRLNREITMLKECRDKNIVQFYGACSNDDDNIMLVTEFMPGGDLYHAMHDTVQGHHDYNWYKRGQYIAQDVARGLCYLHSRRIVHLDLKTPNILLSRDGTAKLADMGLSQVLNDGQPAEAEELGTYMWAAPEVLMNMNLTEKADMYSFGVVLWEIITHEQPKRGCLRPVRVPEECPESIRELVDRCLRVVGEERPNARQAFHVIKRSITAHTGSELGRELSPFKEDH